MGVQEVHSLHTAHCFVIYLTGQLQSVVERMGDYDDKIWRVVLVIFL